VKNDRLRRRRGSWGREHVVKPKPKKKSDCEK